MLGAFSIHVKELLYNSCGLVLDAPDLRYY